MDREGREVRAREGNQPLRYQYAPVPSEWEPLAIEGNDVAWFDRRLDAVIHIDHACGRNQDVPLASLVQHLLAGFTERVAVLEETIPFDGREARHVVYTARLDGVPRTLELYVLKKDGCVFDLGLASPPGSFERASAVFRPWALGFRTTETPGVTAPRP